nr:hypothetical protein [Tanacetum cinerariifolium]
MTSFGYRLNPRYAIKECLSCGALYTGDFCCSKGNVEDKILVLKLPKNCASTNVVNAPRESFVVKQDHGVNSSQNPPHIDECCCECGDALDGIFCQQCTCKACGKGPHETFHCQPPQYIVNHPIFNAHNDLLSSQTTLMEQMTTLTSMCEMILACCDDDDDYNFAFTPVLSSEEPDNSLSVGDEHLDTIPTTESDEVIKSSVEDLVPIPSESEALKDNPTPSFELLTKSSSTSPKSFLEETNTFHNSLPEFENFCFDLEEISSGSTTTHSDISFSEYDSFIFDLSNDQFPPTGRSDFTHKEFADELAHIISPPEYDCFYFRNLPDPSECIPILDSRIRENLSSTTRVNLPVEDDHSPLLAYVVWIFLAYLAYPVIPPYIYSFGNEDTIFDPGIAINRFYLFKPGLSHRCGTFKKFNTHRSPLD